jgi:hypothetical protein
MFPHTLSLPLVARRFGGVALGLSVCGMGLSFAQDRRPGGGRPAAERPIRSMDRPPATIMPDRPAQGQMARPMSPMARPVPVRPATNAIILPRPMERCMNRPTTDYWRQRDIMAEIQAMARRGFIAVHPVGDAVNEFMGVSDFPAGWKAYGFRVPPGENIQVRLHHSNEGWFRLGMVNKWGSLEQGMLQNLIPTGNPEVKYTNPSKEARSVYVVVDDPGWMSSKDNPFTVKVSRSWDPAQKKVDDAPIVTGIWAQKKEEVKPEPAAKEVPAAEQPKG